MKQPKTFLLLSVIVAVLVLGIAYAAISSVSFNVTGNVTASPSDANFVVKFTNAEVSTVKGAATGTAKISTGDKDATIELSGFTTIGDEAKVDFTITNSSEDIYALLTLTKCELTGADKEYFEISYDFNQNFIAPKGGTAILTVNVKLVKTPIDTVTAAAVVNFDAAPSHTNS